ncbi:MAG: hypothetical protein JNK15_09595 [Planctomycetes bacterium]|nr:hypothetical protein [Planctomycetota bacterium]
MARSRKPRRKPAARRKATAPWWAELPTEELLDVRLCDLDLRLEGTAMQARLDRLHDELAQKGLLFRPYAWLATDWFTPEGSTGFAIPFWLAHRRLARLEHTQMFEAEGATHEQCMKLLRHEAAHAFDNAYRLHRRDDWRATFGRYSDPYRVAYQVSPTSKQFVQHLGWWYAQSHPAEDYAESFAVWLAPKSRWQRTYAGWPALQKLRALDRMLRDVGDLPQDVHSNDRPGSVRTARTTLREHYRRRKAGYPPTDSARFDRELRVVFADADATRIRTSAAALLTRERTSLRAKVSRLTGLHRYVVDQALQALAQRCRELDLRVHRPAAEAKLGAAVLATMATMALARGHRPRFRR